MLTQIIGHWQMGPSIDVPLSGLEMVAINSNLYTIGKAKKFSLPNFCYLQGDMMEKDHVI